MVLVPDYLANMERAARLGHAGQKYGNSNRDYFEAHIQPVVDIVRRLGYGPLKQAIAYGHDLIEDTLASPAYLEDLGLPEAGVRAIILLTRRPGQSNEAYLEAIAKDPHAATVKFADATSNEASTMLLSPYMTDEEFRASGQEYFDARVLLRPHMPTPDPNER